MGRRPRHVPGRQLRRHRRQARLPEDAGRGRDLAFSCAQELPVQRLHLSRLRHSRTSCVSSRASRPTRQGPRPIPRSRTGELAPWSMPRTPGASTSSSTSCSITPGTSSSTRATARRRPGRTASIAIRWRDADGNGRADWQQAPDSPSGRRRRLAGRAATQRALPAKGQGRPEGGGDFESLKEIDTEYQRADGPVPGRATL